MKRIRLGVGNKALVVVASLAAGASTIYGCIPDPDISGLPPFDASVAPGFDANALNGLDSAGDVSDLEDGGDDGSATDGPNATATVTGVVINYSQGNGRGVIPNATVTALSGSTTVTTTSNAFGAFVLTGIPAGQVQVSVSKATDETAGLTYSTTQVVLTLTENQSVSVFPVLHQGCFETVSIGGTAGSVATDDDGMTCSGTVQLTGTYAKVQYGVTSFVTPSNGATFSGTARFEMIPIAFPATPSATTDFAWALGLPGATTPVETIGATEFRVIDEATGEQLGVAAGDTNVVLTVPTWTLGNTTAFKPYFYNLSTGTWGAEPNATITLVHTISVSEAPNIDLVDIQVPHLTWWSVTDPTPQTTCVTGSVTVNGAPAPNVWVHATGLNYVGASSAVTDGNGAFCVDVKSAPSPDAGDASAVPQIGVAAGYASTTGGFFSLPTSGFQVSSLGGGTCATKTGCTAIGAIALAPFDSTCVNGSVTRDDGGSLSSTLDVELVGLSGGGSPVVSSSQLSAGIVGSAYIGTTALGDGGAFCAAAAAGSVALVDPAGSSCQSADISVLGGTGSTCAAAGGSGCTAAGAVSITCAH
jgi:hypothetical protein